MSLNIQNIGKLIAHMRTLRPNQFSMKYVFTAIGGGQVHHVPDPHVCATAACIAGECAFVSKAPKGTIWGSETAGEWLGISDWNVYNELFCPDGFYDFPGLFPLPRAIDVLCHLRDKGEVRWDLFPAENYRGEPWTAPQAIEIREPELPETLTRLLGAKVEA